MQTILFAAFFSDKRSEVAVDFVIEALGPFGWFASGEGNVGALIANQDILDDVEELVEAIAFGAKIALDVGLIDVGFFSDDEGVERGVMIQVLVDGKHGLVVQGRDFAVGQSFIAIADLEAFWEVEEIEADFGVFHEAQVLPLVGGRRCFAGGRWDGGCRRSRFVGAARGEHQGGESHG